ncbi:GNAT family N-acetyltransferase [Halonatronum saccharophilum]|uniref:GNAT family N-acetyltransferase n=1 Tax=Halonatronum saccharophilum TaxID=150060 RepID=UPI000483CAC4|nr:GNAT family N-acetyltransferase [Halonatronum saccharophilum]
MIVDKFNFEIEEVLDSQRKAMVCEDILRSLPEWFGVEDAIKDYIEGVKDKCFFLAKVEEKVVGFLAIKDHNDHTSELYVMGILEGYHRKGIGKELIIITEERLKGLGRKFFTVKTLGEGRESEHYDRTRKFYSGIGFYPLEEFKELWDEDNPCLFMVKSLG